jgi:hypothetical protein
VGASNRINTVSIENLGGPESNGERQKRTMHNSHFFHWNGHGGHGHPPQFPPLPFKLCAQKFDFNNLLI